MLVKMKVKRISYIARLKNIILYKLIKKVYESSFSVYIISKDMIDTQQQYYDIDIKNVICDITEHYLY